MSQNPNDALTPKRKEQRLRTVLPVRIFGLDSLGKPFTDIAHTLDISPRGARIGGLKHQLSIGDVVGMQRGMEKARFRVCWVGACGTRCQDQAGLHCVQPEKCIWPDDVLALKKDDDFIPLGLPPDRASLSVPAPARECDRRTHTRFPCNFGAEFEVDGSPIKLWARCTDLSSGGCYLETRSPLKPGARLKLRMSGASARIEANCIVRTCHPDFGMGVRFEDLLPQARVALTQMLHRVTVEQPEQAAPAIRTGPKQATVILRNALHNFEAELEHRDVEILLSQSIHTVCDELRALLAELERDPKSHVPGYSNVEPLFLSEITH